MTPRLVDPGEGPGGCCRPLLVLGAQDGAELVHDFHVVVQPVHRRFDQLIAKILGARDIAKPLEDQDADVPLGVQCVLVLLEGERDELLGFLRASLSLFRASASRSRALIAARSLVSAASRAADSALFDATSCPFSRSSETAA